ncbi:MAG: hypothetical protein NT141_02195 [candidate division WWE3 bacterium]|nr:hypothetical protein [candidate division WWE3 bacterium]
MKSRLSLSLILLILISTFSIGSFILAKPVKADVLDFALTTVGLKSLNDLRHLATDMDKWTSNLAVAGVNAASQTLIFGNCDMSEVTAASKDRASATVEVRKCLTNSPLTNMKPQSSQVMPPSLLGVTYAVTSEAPKRVDLLPVNLALYINDIKRDSPLVPQSAYAAGTLADGIFGTTVLDLWKAFRNLAYLLFVIILVAFGFMVMFRHEIKPQTVITVQDALPKVVVCLLLITFSYPIAGFAIKLIPVLGDFVGKLVVGGVFSQPDMVDVLVQLVVSALGVVALSAAGASGVGTGVALFVLCLLLVLVVTYILALIAVGISYFTRFGRIMLMTIFAPLQFLVGALPGKDEMITSWFKSLIGNVLAIPAMWLFVSLGTNILIKGPTIMINQIVGDLNSTPFAFLGLIFNWVIGLWFVWTARSIPQKIEAALQVGGGWSPGKPAKPAGKK